MYEFNNDITLKGLNKLQGLVLKLLKYYITGLKVRRVRHLILQNMN